MPDRASPSACAIDDEGALFCWGSNLRGALGRSEPAAFFTTECATWYCAGAPARVASVDDVISVAAGEFYTCAVSSDGTLRCWGQWLNLGVGPSEQHWTHEPQLVPLSDVVQVVAGLSRACALTRGGDVYCWGEGDDTGYPTRLPVRDVVELAPGLGLFCMRDQRGRVECPDLPRTP